MGTGYQGRSGLDIIQREGVRELLVLCLAEGVGAWVRVEAGVASRTIWDRVRAMVIGVVRDGAEVAGVASAGVVRAGVVRAGVSVVEAGAGRAVQGADAETKALQGQALGVLASLHPLLDLRRTRLDTPRQRQHWKGRSVDDLGEGGCNCVRDDMQEPQLICVVMCHPIHNHHVCPLAGTGDYARQLLGVSARHLVVVLPMDEEHGAPTLPNVVRRSKR
mmetsp:Transcript_22772/g.40985  ORF Transcript_22772/g.40985 Transcript_22772/m.40985 type:complete len:219 (+) Transcript_22772:704-1360(+)